MTDPGYSIKAGPDGVVRIGQRGFWDLKTVDGFVDEAEATIEATRARGRLRLIIDASLFDVPAADVSDRLRDFDARIRKEGDRVAMVVGSTLLKMQMKRQTKSPGLEVFASAGAAEEWVKAD